MRILFFLIFLLGSMAAQTPYFDLSTLKLQWKARIESIKMQGFLPLCDIESSFNFENFDQEWYAKTMDEEHIALIAFSAQVGNKAFEKEGKIWSDGASKITQVDPSRYVPTTTAGIYPAWSSEPEAFVAKTIEKVQIEHYPLMGEFEFRHYPSPRQAKRGENERDIIIPIDSPAAHQLFSFSERSGIAFQIHYEVENDLLAPLEKMLQTYPKAKVIWCHLAQIRYSSRASMYTPAYIKTLLDKYPNLYFDLAFGDWDSIYKPSNEYHATIWDRGSHKLKPEWIALIEAYPYRFLSAFDIGGDRHDSLREKAHVSREILKSLSPKTQEIVAYKAFWKLLFNEDI